MLRGGSDGSPRGLIRSLLLGCPDDDRAARRGLNRSARARYPLEYRAEPSVLPRKVILGSWDLRDGGEVTGIALDLVAGGRRRLADDDRRGGLSGRGRIVRSAHPEEDPVAPWRGVLPPDGALNGAWSR